MGEKLLKLMKLEGLVKREIVSSGRGRVYAKSATPGGKVAEKWWIQGR
jgi:hypothetical protein